jgi:hypothetical protein
MDHISSHITIQANNKTRATERGELMQYFMDKLNSTRVRDGLPPLSMARMGRLLQVIPTKDLYYLKSVCEKAPDFSKKFWWEINPKNHTPEAKAKMQAKWIADKKTKKSNEIY